jgi:fructose-bisphosphate aldolase class I
MVSVFLFAIVKAMNQNETARSLIKDGRGIFIFDRADAELSAELSARGCETENALQKFRDALLSTEGAERFLSGVVLSPDALRASGMDGMPYHELLSEKNILIGVSVREDDDTRSLLSELRSMGAVFALTRIVREANQQSADAALKERITAAVAFAKACAEFSAVPVISVEVRADGSHTSGQAEDALVELLSLLSDGLESGALDLKGIIIRSTFAATGLLNPLRAKPSEVAERTLRALSSSLPQVLGGVMLADDLLEPAEAASYLNALSRLEPFSWPISFAFSQSLHIPAMQAWKGAEENIPALQAAFLSRLSLAEAADAAGYSSGAEASGL